MALPREALSQSSLPHLSLAREDALDCLRLIRSENVGPITFFQLIRRYGTAKNALEAIPELAARGGKRQLVVCNKTRAEKEMQAVADFGAEIVLYGEPRYPAPLLHIPDAPPLLTLKGHALLWQKSQAVAIVGARNASANGCQFAYRLAKELGEQNLLVASGLARGIDAAAHKGALATGTFAVIANGIDQIYPPENAALYEQLYESGAVVTEQPFGAAPQARSFPARNRIISGMSLGTVVVEASFKSGSLITARVAAEQGREVFAVPGSPLDAHCKGTNDLIRQGATLTESVKDILPHLSRNHTSLAEVPSSHYLHAVMAVPNESEMEKLRARVLGKLGATPVSIDELVGQCEVTPNLLLTILLELELAGRLERSPVNRVSLRYQENE